MVMWDEAFCSALAERGYFVIRFDKREIGQSTHMDSAGIPSIARFIADIAAGKPVEVPYLLFPTWPEIPSVFSIIPTCRWPMWRESPWVA